MIAADDETRKHTLVLTKRRLSPSQVSLARALSKLGFASRSQARTVISSGRITVNGTTVRDPGAWLDLKTDRLALDGKELHAARKMYAVMNKPLNVVTTRADERGRTTVYDLLPPVYAGCFPVGRLDKETSGLLVFTNDTRFGESITSPVRKVPKSYIVTLDRPLAAVDQRQMERGATLEDGTTFLPASVVVEEDAHHCTITIVEGKNRQIRRMLENLGYSILSLSRVRIGPISLGGLSPGKVRDLSDEELLQLRKTDP